MQQSNCCKCMCSLCCNYTFHCQCLELCVISRNTSATRAINNTSDIDDENDNQSENENTNENNDVLSRKHNNDTFVSSLSHSEFEHGDIDRYYDYWSNRNNNISSYYSSFTYTYDQFDDANTRSRRRPTITRSSWRPEDDVLYSTT